MGLWWWWWVVDCVVFVGCVYGMCSWWWWVVSSHYCGRLLLAVVVVWVFFVGCPWDFLLLDLWVCEFWLFLCVILVGF